MAIAKPNYPGGVGGGTGLPFKVVDIMEVAEDGVARCLDRFGNEHKISVAACRSKALLPLAGERWLIDQQYGGWAFAMILSGFQIPEVTGSRAATDAVTRSLLDALVSLGLVRDGTTP